MFKRTLLLLALCLSAINEAIEIFFNRFQTAIFKILAHAIDVKLATIQVVYGSNELRIRKM